jgi:hypothetical protein
LVLFLSYAPLAYAKVWINEFSSSGSNDWVELYNDAPETVQLDQFRLRDNTISNKLDLSGEIAAHGFAVFEWGSKLNNGGDTIRLIAKNDENTNLDIVLYAAKNADVTVPAVGQVGGRQTDGSTPWVIFAADTKGTTNNEAPLVPTITPLPQNTPTSVPQPTPTRVPTPTRTPTPVKPSPTPKITITPKPSVTLTVTPVIKKISPAVLGSSTKISGVPTSAFDIDMGGELVTPAPIGVAGSQEVIVKNAQTSPMVLTIVGGVFMLACGILMVFRKRIWKKKE